MTDATKHLLSSPKNAARLREAMKGPFTVHEIGDLKIVDRRTYREHLNETANEEIPEEFKRLLDLLD